MVEHAGDVDACAIKGAEKARILDDGQLRLDTVIVADPAGQPAAFFCICDRIADTHLHTDFTGRRWEQPGQNSQCGAFSRAVGTFERQDLTGSGRKIDVAENPPPASLTGEPLHFNERENGHSRPLRHGTQQQVPPSDKGCLPASVQRPGSPQRAGSLRIGKRQLRRRSQRGKR
jgi:hypothetical protein